MEYTTQPLLHHIRMSANDVEQITRTGDAHVDLGLHPVAVLPPI
jgi:hypothetical protein